MTLSRILICLFCLTLSSCSFSALNPLNWWEEEPKEILYEAKEPPIEVSVANAEADHELLNVEVLLRPKTVLDTRNIAVGVIGLNEGEAVASEVKLLKDVFDFRTLEENKEYRLTFVLPSEGINEYQVKCSWGEDVRKLVKEGEVLESPVTKQELHVGADLEIESSKLVKEKENCRDSSCEVFYRFNAVLVNNTERVINGVSLGLGIFWKDASGNLVLPQDLDPLSGNEQLVPLEGIRFSPGARKQLKLKLDRGVPIVDGGEFVPHLRIVSFEKNEHS